MDPDGEARLAKEVIEFVRSRRADPWERVDASTRVNLDLGADGDEADDFMHEFFTRFQVDSSGFVFYDYFGPEVSGAMWFLNWGRFSKPLQPLPVQRLINAAVTRRWMS